MQPLMVLGPEAIGAYSLAPTAAQRGPAADRVQIWIPVYANCQLSQQVCLICLIHHENPAALSLQCQWTLLNPEGAGLDQEQLQRACRGFHSENHSEAGQLSVNSLCLLCNLVLYVFTTQTCISNV